MRRREFIALLGGAAAGWPLAARAQQGERVRRIGVLVSGNESDPEMQARVAPFRQELEKLGWSEGRNIRIETVFAASKTDQYSRLAKEMIATQPEVIFSHTTPLVAAFRRESRTIPIVFVNVSDPIGSGLVESLARPGGNVTGLMLYEEGITGKWLAMLKEIAPNLARVGSWPTRARCRTTIICGRPRRELHRSESRSCRVPSAAPPTSNAALNPPRVRRTGAWLYCRPAGASCIAI
jgi:putative ABC transport system substrate-binding protein